MSETIQVTGRQIAAARALTGMDQATLANAARISVQTLRRMEACEGSPTGYANNVAAVIAALESAGIEFIAENGGGPGVRLTKRGARGDQAAAIQVEDLNAENDE